MKKSNYVWTFGSRILVIGLTAIFGIISARLLGPNEKGMYTVATLVPAMISTIAMLSGPQLVLMDMSSGGPITARLKSLLAWSTTSAACGATLYIILQFSVFPTNATTALVGISALVAPTLIIPEYLAATIQARHRFRELATLRLSQIVLPSVLMVLGLIQNGLIGAILGFILGNIAVSAVAIFLWNRLCRIGPQSTSDFRKIPWSFVLVTNLSLVLLFLSYRIDVLILNIVSTPGEVGLYAAAVAVSELVLVASMSISVVRTPVYSRDRSMALKKDAWIVAGISILCAGILFLISPVVVPQLFGEEYKVSVNVIWALLPGICALAVYRYVSSAEIVRGHKFSVLISSGVSLVFDVLFILLFGSELGAVGAGLAASIAYSLGLVYLIIHRALRQVIKS